MSGQTAPRAPEAGRVRFVLDGERVEVEGIEPTRTVLEWLREERGRTGTKEGCAEGDCGACTVVVGEPDGGRVRLRAVNACIRLLATLDGKELFTVESLGSPAGGLHPVQRALVETHASQCGFCTPGFVMSLFALYRSERAPGRARIEEAISGNLCRCTGYRPILEAGERMGGLADEAAHPDARRQWLAAPFSPDAIAPAEREAAARLESLRRRDTLEIARDGRRFLAPASLEALAGLLETHPEAVLLAGGTDVGLTLTKALHEPGTLIYVGNVPELLRIEVLADRLEIGAAVSLTDAFAAIAARYPDLGELFRRFASPPIRNAATLGGNIANGSPVGDSMPALIALGASLALRQGARRRELPLEDFYLAHRRTALRAGELVERVLVPLPRPGQVVRAWKVSKRYDQDIAAVCAAFRLELAGGRASAVRAAFGGMAATPRRALRCEGALEGRAWDERALEAGMAALDADFAPISDHRASAGYRATVARNLLRRLYLETSAPSVLTRVHRHAGAAA